MRHYLSAKILRQFLGKLYKNAEIKKPVKPGQGVSDWRLERFFQENLSPLLATPFAQAVRKQLIRYLRLGEASSYCSLDMFNFRTHYRFFEQVRELGDLLENSDKEGDTQVISYLATLNKYWADFRASCSDPAQFNKLFLTYSYDDYLHSRLLAVSDSGTKDSRVDLKFESRFFKQGKQEEDFAGSRTVKIVNDLVEGLDHDVDQENSHTVQRQRRQLQEVNQENDKLREEIALLRGKMASKQH